jgi:hypothetical protein
MIMMSHDAYTHQKSKSLPSVVVEMTTPPHPFLLVLTEPQAINQNLPPM